MFVFETSTVFAATGMLQNSLRAQDCDVLLPQIPNRGAKLAPNETASTAEFVAVEAVGISCY
jgi:hypothetical protein